MMNQQPSEPTEVRPTMRQRWEGIPLEYRKFGILVAVMFGCVLAVAIGAPRFFDKALPAILGLPSGGRPEAITVPSGLPLTRELLPAIKVGGPSDASTHTVRPGETIQQIAALYGLTVEELARANNLLNPYQVTPGARLVIPD
jgi:hypothetical protein